jgi:hypothetical protein
MAGELYISHDLPQVNRANGHAPEEWLIDSGPSRIGVRNLCFLFSSRVASKITRAGSRLGKDDKTVIRGSQSINVFLLYSNHDRELQSIFCPPFRWRYRNGLRRLLRVPVTGCKYDTVYSNTSGTQKERREREKADVFHASGPSQVVRLQEGADLSRAWSFSIYRYTAKAARSCSLCRERLGKGDSAERSSDA